MTGKSLEGSVECSFCNKEAKDVTCMVGSLVAH